MKIPDLFQNGLAPVEVAAKVLAINKVLADSSEYSAFEIGHDPLDSWQRYQLWNLELEEIVLELRTSFPTVVPEHPLNLNDENIDDYNMSFESDDEL
ncbi:hypothetical protein OUZ56_012582 [Daphnia magna]|uniref:Uncharacterized protein n=1 Tax=Daphnia magna TaxID=35525 RepID=A0ABQ9Z3F7_9CRUS|nr:hypothetical protein OUZ56_012582 [Daphnia magna]